MKKERQRHNETMKEHISEETESYKLENKKLNVEISELLLKLNEKEKSELQLQSDIKKLGDNNENVIILCNNIRKEKLDLENKLEKIECSLSQVQDEKEGILKLLSIQFNQHFLNLDCLKQFFEQELKAYCSYLCAEEINALLDKNLSLKNNVDELNNSISILLKERESTENNFLNLSNKMQKLKSELAVVTSDRDQILTNLESVRLETKSLIENSEKVADELENLKAEKIKNEHEMKTLLINKNEEIENVRDQLLGLQQYCVELKANWLSCNGHVNMVERKPCDCYEENLQTSVTDNCIVNRESKKNEAANECAIKFMSEINKLSEIKNTFSNISESVKIVGLKLLQKEVQASELELIKVMSGVDPMKNSEGDCPNINCTCYWLKNIGTKLKESMTYYEKILTELKREVEFSREESMVISNKDKLFERVKEEFNLDIVRDKRKYPEFRISENIEVENIFPKVEEYVILNSLLEKKIKICREELDFALIQLHNAEELGELMQSEIYSLQSHLCEAISEREKLNEIINEKIQIISKFDEDLSAEQSKSLKLLSDLHISQIELNAAKNALDAEKTKSNQLTDYLENSQSDIDDTKSALAQLKFNKLFSEVQHSQIDFLETTPGLNPEKSQSSQFNKDEDDKLRVIRQTSGIELLTPHILMRDSKNSQVKFNEVKHALDTEKTKKLVSVLQCTQSELNEVKRALAAEQSKTNQLTRKLKNAELENYETKLVLQDEKLKSNKLIDDLKNSQCYLSEVKEALDVEKSNFKKLINDLGKLQSELNNTKQTLNSEQIKSRNLIDSLENSQGQLNAAKDALLAEQTKSNILIKNLDKSQNELNYTTKALRNEECKSSKLITELENSHLKLNEVNHLLKEKCKIICDLKEESTNLNCETSSLSESNLKLKQENDSLKINIDTLLEQIETTKLKEIQGAKEFIDIKRSNELLTIKLVKLEETNNLLTSKLSSCKMNVDDFRKEISKLKTYCKNLIEDQRSSLRKNHQDIVKSVANFIAIGTASESLLKEDLHDFEIQKEVGFRSTELQENKLSLEIASKNESVGVVECYCLKKKHLVDNECQVNILQNEINETLIQELRKGANSSNKSSISRKDEISKSEVELLSERNTSKIQSLETNLALSKQELLTTQLEINQLRDEFYSYRLRAQALLSKQKGELESQREKEAKEQIEKLNNELENIRGKMEIILTEDESLKYRVATLQSEKEVIDKKYDDISRALHQKIIDYDTLNTEYNAFKLSTDTFIHNNKIVLEEKYKSEITAKDAIINKLKSDLKENDSAKPDDQISEISQFNASVNDTEEILQEREDGEGSETVPIPFADRHEFVPLDVLINNEVDDEESQVAILKEQVNTLTAELSSHDIRSKHLSSLLREAEKESARNSQQNAVLKEEVRRLERCLERQPLVANAEYLKNVVFKFFTLQSADERTRLVPVLDSILKLSPAEAQKLNEVARGAGSSNWSSYLNSWSGLG
ncbi:uncharacterized protein isoform X2 [Rhodnius prolixus]